MAKRARAYLWHAAVIAGSIAALDPAGASAAAPDMAAGPLEQQILALSARFGVPLLFDRKMTRGRRGHAIKHAATFDDGLRQALEGTGLDVRRTPAGIYTIVVSSDAPRVVADTRRQNASGAIADILVVGRETENVAISRTADAVQPYSVIGTDRIAATQSVTAGSLVFEQQSMNLPTVTALSQFRQAGFGSVIDLNGLGSINTLVTVDGRRLPGVPDEGRFAPPDIGPIMADAIERIETLGTTAGAVYGVGASGGTTNVVLKRDYNGFRIASTNGVSARGDAVRHTIEARGGITSTGGSFKAMFSVGYSRDSGVLNGDRSAPLEAKRIFAGAFPNVPPTASGSIQIQSVDGSNLTLANQYGGKTLSSSKTLLPWNAPAIGSGGLGLLTQNAGRSDLSLSPDGQGSAASLVPATRSLSVLGSVRQSLGSSVELFADGLLLRDQIDAQSPLVTTQYQLLAPGQGGNPFQQLVFASFPTPGLTKSVLARYQTDRETIGVIVRVGSGWSVNADASRGGGRAHVENSGAVIDTSGIDLFAGENALTRQFSDLPVQKITVGNASDKMVDTNIRAAGPILHLPGGDVTATVTGEWHLDRQPPYVERVLQADGTALTSSFGLQQQGVASGFGEVRLPILPQDRGPAPIRGLTLDVAVRHDSYRIDVANTLGSSLYGPTIRSKGAVTSVSAGLRVSPFEGLTVRASYGDGYETPTPAQITPGSAFTPLDFINDPKRGGALRPDTGLALELFGGTPQLRAQHARTFSVGFVAKPDMAPGFRFSVDFTRLVITNEISDLDSPDVQFFVDNEQVYPGRIQRAPLTPQDAALGYSAGRITEIDATRLSDGQIRLSTLNFALDYRHAIRWGSVHLYGQATWQPQFREKPNVTVAAFDLAGTANGPIKWRGVLGAQWTAGRLSVGAEGQFYAGFNTRYLDGSPIDAGVTDFVQNVKSRSYIDATIGYRSDVTAFGRKASIVYRLGVRNLLDLGISPIASTVIQTAYNPYNDLIGRRLEFKIACEF